MAFNESEREDDSGSAEIAEDLEAALAQFAEIAASLSSEPEED